MTGEGAFIARYMATPALLALLFIAGWVVAYRPLLREWNMIRGLIRQRVDRFRKEGAVGLDQPARWYVITALYIVTVLGCSFMGFYQFAASLYGKRPLPIFGYTDWRFFDSLCWRILAAQMEQLPILFLPPFGLLTIPLYYAALLYPSHHALNASLHTPRNWERIRSMLGLQFVLIVTHGALTMLTYF